jgi:hypothetical protein
MQLPKGGRRPVGQVETEDQFLHHRRRRTKKDNEVVDAFDPDFEFGAQRKNEIRANRKKNPNEGRKRTGKRKKKNRA